MFNSIRSKIILLLLLFSFIPLVVSRAIIYPKVWKAFQEARIRDLESIGYKQANHITTWMQERKYDAKAFADEFLVSSFTSLTPGSEQFSRLTSHLRLLGDTYGYKEISIIDSTGKIRVSTRDDLIGADVGGFDYFKEAIKGATFVSNIRPSTFPILNEYDVMEEGVPTLFVSSPVRDNAGQIVGVISLRVDVMALSKEMRKVKMGESGETYLVNKNGFMISESRFVPTIKKMGLIKKRTALELKLVDPETGELTKGVQACLRGESGYDANGYRDYRGILVLGFWHWLPEYQWALMSEIDVEEAYRALYDLDRAILWVSIAIALAVVAGVIFLGPKIAAPILHLTEVTRQMSMGNLSQRAKIYSRDEIGQLADSFNTMAQTIETRNKQLESAKQYLESMFDAIRDPITVVDREGTILRVNQAAIDEYGKDIVGRNCVEVFMGKGQTCPGCRNLEVIENLKPYSHEHTVPGKDKVVSTEAYPLLDSSGRLEAIIMVSRDITQQKRLEQRLQRYTLDLENTVAERTKTLSRINKELEEKNIQLEKANAELRTLDKLKDSIIRDVTHELKGPVAQVKMAFDLWAEELARGTVEKSKEKKLHSIINHNIARLQKTITAVLDLSNIESGQIKYKRERFRMEELIQQVLSEFVIAAEQKGITIKTNIPQELPQVIGDKEHLARVVYNLIDNAVRYTPEGEITIAAVQKDSGVEVSVTDTGVGITIPKEEYNRLFERFYQEKPRYDGVGVGLAICKAIVEAHGGSIRAESEGPGKGSTFSFTIPIHPTGVAT